MPKPEVYEKVGHGGHLGTCSPFQGFPSSTFQDGGSAESSPGHGGGGTLTQPLLPKTYVGISGIRSHTRRL